MTFDEAIQKLKEGFSIYHPALDDPKAVFAIILSKDYIDSHEWYIQDAQTSDN